MNEISKIDLKLLGELENDSRQTFSQIAKRLKTSQQVISYRIDSFLKKNLISGFYTLINFALLGYTSYRTMIRFTYITENKSKEIISYLTKHSNVLWIVECGGRWDLIVNFMAKNIVQYDLFLKEFKSKFPKQIQNYDVLTTIGGIYFGRDYFTKSSREIKDFPYFGREFKEVPIDKRDLQILNLISEDARMNSVEIADRLKTSPNTIISRIKDLKEKEFIQGFKPLIHLENTPYSAYKALIKFQNISEGKEKEMINYLKLNVNITGILNFVGQWDFEIEFEVEKKEQMLALTRGFRDKFSEVIKEFEIIPLFHEYRYNYFPKDLIDN